MEWAERPPRTATPGTKVGVTPAIAERKEQREKERAKRKRHRQVKAGERLREKKMGGRRGARKRREGKKISGFR